MGENFLLGIKIYALVIVVSMLVAVMIRGIVYTLSAFKKKTPAAAPAPVAKSKPVAAAADPAEHDVAVIAAALYATLGAHRIVHIEDRRGMGWTAEGRMAHHTSHAIQHKPKK